MDIGSQILRALTRLRGKSTTRLASNAMLSEKLGVPYRTVQRATLKLWAQGKIRCWSPCGSPLYPHRWYVADSK